MDDAGASASASTLAGTTRTRADPSGQAVLGPGLVDDMGGPALVAALNAWGGAMHGEVLALRADLGSTQAAVAGAFGQAEATVRDIVTAFQAEVVAMRQTTLYEAQASLNRLEVVVSEAKARFGEQDARFTTGLAELAQRLQEADTWAQGEHGRVAAVVNAVPVPEWLRAVRGSPPPVPSTPLPRAAQPQPPQQPQQQQQQPQQQLPQEMQPPGMSPAWAAWAANRAGPDPAAGAWAQAPPLPVPAQAPAAPPGIGWRRSFDIATPGAFGAIGGSSGKPKELRINARDWGDGRKLDVTTSFEHFQVWKDRATMFLSKERPDVRLLLTWAEAQSQVDLEANLCAQAAHLGVDDLLLVEFGLHDGIKTIIVDGLLGRARNCVGKGLELWRALVAEWSGGGDHVLDARARRYIDPPRAKDVADLWAKIPSWERLGEEVLSAGFPLPEWLRNTSLEKLLPTQLLSTLVTRSELKGYAVRLAWVKSQMEHTRGVQQAAAYGPGTGKDASGDVYMNSVEAAAEQPENSLTWALANAVDQGDWDQAESLKVAIYALKGGGKGGYRKGGLGKGAAPPAAAAKGAAGAGFQGNCNHCGAWGHRKNECRKLDQELGKKGGAKGGAKGAGKGGKGGAKGGKGPPSDPISEVAAAAAGADWAAELGTGAETADYDEWYFGNTISSVTPWVQAPAGRGRRGGRTWRPFSTGSGMAGTPTAVHNSFSGLNSLREDATRGPVDSSAVPGTRGGPVDSSAVPGTLRMAAVAIRGPVGSAAAPGTRRGPESSIAPGTQRGAALIASLREDADALLGAVAGETSTGGKWVEAAVDSGAVHSVAPPGLFPGATQPSPWSRAGRGYRAANGTSIKNLGQIEVPFATAEGFRCRLPFQVAEVEQALLSVSHLTSAGNIVQFGDTDGNIVNRTTGRSIALERRGGIYYMKMWVPDVAAALPFRRQGA